MSPVQAVATFLARVPLEPLGVERVPVDAAHGRILADAIAADADYPIAPRSAMDGFAVRAADVPGRVRITGEVHMGAAWPHALRAGEAVRIPTGGVVPEGADTVAPVEETKLDGAFVDVAVTLQPGENINARASDMHAGERVLTPGAAITAPHAGLLATLGITHVPVYRKPLVAVLSSGDELIAPEATPRVGQIRDSNRYAIAATLRAMGADVLHVPTVSDEAGELERALREALARADAVMLTGGSSVGERDRTPAAIEALGAAPGVIVHGLRVKPGKPTVFAAAGRKPIVGLPGNPTSAVVILQAIAAPIVAALTGRSETSSERLEARLAAPVSSRPGWTWYVPVSLKQEAEHWVAHPLPLRSSTVSIIARAHGYVVVPENVETYPPGTTVPVTRFI
ncbi:MAG: molybdopterin molybdotransferase MoeA [Candidatus Eremiobacteraeota bacterium]|nr:molybdopterin molybdotransferase MoeA [Candidatus Eremiobacteraeota bacterium]